MIWITAALSDGLIVLRFMRASLMSLLMLLGFFVCKVWLLPVPQLAVSELSWMTRLIGVLNTIGGSAFLRDVSFVVLSMTALRLLVLVCNDWTDSLPIFRVLIWVMSFMAVASLVS